MIIRVHNETGLEVPAREIKETLPNLSFAEQSDLAEFGYPFLKETPQPLPIEGKMVVRGQNQKVKARNVDGTFKADNPDTKADEAWEWQTTWIQVDLPPEEIPQSISRAQGKAVLIKMGLWPSVLSFVSSIEDEEKKALAEVALNDTQEWKRESEFLNTAALALNISKEQMDQMFLTASKVDF